MQHACVAVMPSVSINHLIIHVKHSDIFNLSSSGVLNNRLT